MQDGFDLCDIRKAGCETHPALKTPFLKTIIYIFKVFAGAGAFFKKLPAWSRCLREGMWLFVVISSSSTTKVVPLPLSWGRLVLSTELLIDILHIYEPVLAAEVVVTLTDVIERFALAEDGFCLRNFVAVN